MRSTARLTDKILGGCLLACGSMALGILVGEFVARNCLRELTGRSSAARDSSRAARA